jgi:type VI protein secretion system component Hcp
MVLDAAPAIQGDSKSATHTGGIDLEGFCLPGAGGPRFGPFTVQKLYDRSSPALLQRMADGTLLPTVTVSFVQVGPSGSAEWLTYKFSDVRVAGYRAGGHGNPLAEDLAFSWGKVEATYKLAGHTTSFTYIQPAG